MGWSDHNPELLDELTIKHLPQPWKKRVEDGVIELDQVPDVIRGKAMDEGLIDHHSSLIDAAKERRKYGG
jgi:hypothetical protein